MNKRSVCWIVLAALLVMFAAGCKKKVPPPPPPPPPPQEKPAPPPPKPSAPGVSSFTAEPASIERGQAATLRWSVSGAERLSIDQGVGTVQASGNRQVFPSASTTYTLTATGPGGTSTATARVSVTQPAPPPPPAPPPAKPKRTISDALASEVLDVYFDYDKYDVREDARSVLSRNSDALKRIFQEFPATVITVEGHCDERGSAEYNLGLGDQRSKSSKDFLTQLGLPADRLRTVSYGKERPQCTEASEDCYQKNRRVHFAAGQ